MGEFISELKNVIGVRVLPYHNYAGSKYESLSMENTLPERTPTNEEMEAARNIIQSYGIKVIK